MGESEIISILSNSEIFNLTSILKTLIRGIGWGIINLLAFISNGIETVVNEIYSLNGFFSSQQLNDFIDELLPLAWVILALSIVFLGYKLIFDREFRINNIFKNMFDESAPKIPPHEEFQRLPEMLIIYIAITAVVIIIDI